MPWSSQNGGGWKSGNNGGPWGKEPPGGNQSPDLEDILRKSQDKLKQAMPGGGMNNSLMFLVVLAGLAVIAFFGFTVKVQPDELGIVLRFGKFDRELTQGLNFRLPYPVETVYLPKVTRINRIEVGVVGASSARGFSNSGRDVPAESLMLTGDENIVDVDFVVFWRINNASDYLFNIVNQPLTVKEVAESAMREVVGQSDIQPILTEEREKTESAVQKLMQSALDSYKSGIQITQVKMQKVDPPSQVIDAYRDVQAAKADQERIRNEAQAYANRVVPEARGEAERIMQAAQAYRDRVVAEANGQANRFLKVYEEYKKAPEVTRKRLFLETMERVFVGTDKIILDGKNGNSGVVPYLPLNEITKNKAGAR